VNIKDYIYLYRAALTSAYNYYSNKQSNTNYTDYINLIMYTVADNIIIIYCYCTIELINTLY